MKKIAPFIIAALLISCGGSLSNEDKMQMCNEAESQLKELYRAEGITAYGIKCEVSQMELEGDSVARGRLSVEFDDWSKEPSPNVKLQAMVKFGKLHNVVWKLRPRSIDVFLSISSVGTDINENDSTYILKSFMTETDYE